MRQSSVSRRSSLHGTSSLVATLSAAVRLFGETSYPQDDASCPIGGVAARLSRFVDELVPLSTPPCRTTSVPVLQSVRRGPPFTPTQVPLRVVAAPEQDARWTKRGQDCKRVQRLECACFCAAREAAATCAHGFSVNGNSSGRRGPHQT